MAYQRRYSKIKLFNSITRITQMSQQQYAQEKLELIQSRIVAAERNAGRVTGSVTLIGASKKQSTDLITAFASAGLQNVGENYLQEGIAKRQDILALGQSEESPSAGEFDSLTWHFIGHIQSNKTKPIAQHFSWVHGVDRVKVARRLAEQNPRATAINILIQLNLDAESSKSGVDLKNASQLADEVAQLLETLNLEHGGAQLRGFMAIPMARDSFDEQRATFARAQELLTLTNQRYGLKLNELSMGMSGDLEAAIYEGATMVRIGTDLFGARR